MHGNRLNVILRMVTGSAHALLEGRRWMWLVAGVMLWTLLGSDRGLVRLISLWRDRAGLVSEIQGLEKSCSTLSADYGRLTSDPFALEKLIREDLDWGRRSETVYKFPSR